jgi:putative transposase
LGYNRLLWWELNGKRRWYVQLINEGTPYEKEKNYVADGVIGLDLNIANIAFVGDKKAGLLPFVHKVLTVSLYQNRGILQCCGMR